MSDLLENAVKSFNDLSPEQQAKMQTALAALQRENAALTARVKVLEDECKCLVKTSNNLISQRDQALNTCAQMEEDNEALEVKLAEARKALEPFANAYLQMGRLKDQSVVYGQPAVGIGGIALKADFSFAYCIVRPDQELEAKPSC